MKKVLSILYTLSICITAFSQSDVVNIELLRSVKDATLGTKSSVIFLSYEDNIMISSSNHSDIINPSVKQADGRFATQVDCQMDNVGADPSRNFTVTIKNNTLNGKKKITMSEGTKVYLQVTQAEHMINALWPETKNILYPIEGKSCIEFQIPIYINDLEVKSSEGIGGNVTRKSENGINILIFEVDCKKLENIIKLIDTKKEQIVNLEKAVEEQTKFINTNNKDWTPEKWDAEEAKETELKKSLEAARDEVPELFIRLMGPKSNSIDIGIDKIKEMVRPKMKLTANIIDALHKETVFATAYDQLMGNANQAFLARKYNEASKMYFQAAEDTLANEQQRSDALTFAKHNEALSAIKVEANTFIKAINSYKKSKELLDYNEVEECYINARTDFERLYDLTHDSYYQKMIDKLNNSLDAFGQVVVGIVYKTGFHQGAVSEEAITGIDIYGIEGHYDAKKLEKMVFGEKIGTTKEDGTFHLQFDKGKYKVLQFVPTPSAIDKGVKGNKYIVVDGKKHLKLLIRFKD